MKSLLIIATLTLPVCTMAQSDTTTTERVDRLNFSFSLHPSSHHTGYGFGFSYHAQQAGVFGLIAMDFNSKANNANLETGVGAELASALPVTQDIESWISITAGFTHRLHKGTWIFSGIGYTGFDSWTEHSNRYWVSRGRNAATNFTIGLMFNQTRKISFNTSLNTAPFSIGLGVGINIDTN